MAESSSTIITFIADSSCNVVPITEWAGTPTLRQDVLPNPVDLVVIIHTVTHECSTDEECENVARSIRKFLMQQGQTDVGYSFLVGGNGKVYEGAGWGLVGAHTMTYNARSIGIAFIGDFREVLPTPAAMKAAQDLLICGVQNKHLSEEYHLVGHMQLRKTLSPGPALQNVIQTWPHWLADTSVLQK
ncbi:hypothetical protein K1T71_005448 [Dendrolimus kikuchii]|uniref:Uncharacterized protein n=1 Tax=Dendrolimus kikuchii TaxID=765133 RepID=A0ACC1D431_9NEOP|nr:hypothetical protein K1T71_005448 [Dendrolimus kikuchii]